MTYSWICTAKEPSPAPWTPAHPTNPERPIWIVSETLIVTRSAYPSTWTGDHLAGEMGSVRQIWQRALSPRSGLGTPIGCGTSFHSPSPWICCGNRAATLRLNGSLSGTCARPNGSGTSGSVSETLTCGIRSGTCEIVISFLQSSFQTLSGNGCVLCCCENETCRRENI